MKSIVAPIFGIIMYALACSPTASAAFSDKGPCLRGDRQACLRYAKTKGLSREEKMPAFGLACDGGVAEACVILGNDSYKHGDVADGIEKLTHAVELGSPDGAFMLGMIYASKGDTAQAATYYKKGCGLGDQESCTEAKKLGK